MAQDTIKPIASVATDNPNAPQSSVTSDMPVTQENPAKIISTDEMFPLLSKSPGFKEAMKDNGGNLELETSLPPSVVMSRNLNVLENSDIYKNATAEKRIAYQLAFYKKYVEPVYRGSKSQGDFREWLKDRGTYWQFKHNPEANQGGLIPPKVAQGVKAFASGVLGAQLEIMKAGEEAKRKFKEVSKEISLGSALLNAQIMPHMGPIIFDPNYTKVRESKKEEEIDEYLKADKWLSTHGYKQNLTNKLLRGSGEFAGQVPVFVASEGLLGDVVKLPQILKIEEATGVAKLASKSIYNAAQGYLVGTATHEDPTKTAIGFGAGTALFTSAEMLFGKIFGWVGGKGLTEVINNATKEYISKAPETKVSPAAVALAGSQKQKINASVIKALNDMTGGNFYKAPEAAKASALAKLARKSPEFASQIAFIDKTVIGVDAAKDLVAQREAVPELDKILTRLESISKQPTHETVADAVKQHTEVEQIKEEPKRVMDHLYGRETIDPDTGISVAPGAARAKSLEFGDNLTKHVDSQLAKIGLGKDKIIFESRGHKFLFYLNALMSDQQRLGPSKDRNLEFNALLNKLHEEFPKDTLPDLIKKSDKVWTDVEQASKAGIMKEGEVFKYWRNHSSPGEAPLSHEVKLLQQAQQAELKNAEALKKVPQTPTETKEEELNRKMKEAFAKTSSKDTMKLGDAIQKLYPNKKFEELTSEERRRAINVSLGKDPDFK